MGKLIQNIIKEDCSKKGLTICDLTNSAFCSEKNGKEGTDGSSRGEFVISYQGVDDYGVKADSHLKLEGKTAEEAIVNLAKMYGFNIEFTRRHK